MPGSLLRSPIIYPGGKGHMVHKLLKLIPEHDTYVEVFGGGGSLLFAKPPSAIEVYNDIDGLVVNLFRVLRDPEKSKKLQELLLLTPYSREEFNYCRDKLLAGSDELDDVEKARMFCVVSRQSVGAGGLYSKGWRGGWGYAVRNVTFSRIFSWTRVIGRLDEIAGRLRAIQIERDDFRLVIPRFDTEKTFFYLDPPYVSDTRKTKKLYTHEMSRADHEELISLILRVRGKVLLSGYDNEIYRELDRTGWRRMEWRTACSLAGRTRGSGLQGAGAALAKAPRTEVVWFNYDLPAGQLF